MTLAIARSPFTDDVLATLAGLGFPVGDGRIPRGANWIGAPNAPAASFKPYLVLSEIVASHSSGPFADSQGDWQLPYMVESFGISRRACGLLADRALDTVKGLRSHGWDIDGVHYGCQQVRLDSLGEAMPVAAVYPPVWHQQSGFTIWVGKGAS